MKRKNNKKEEEEEKKKKKRGKKEERSNVWGRGSGRLLAVCRCSSDIVSPTFGPHRVTEKISRFNPGPSDFILGLPLFLMFHASFPLIAFIPRQVSLLVWPLLISRSSWIKPCRSLIPGQTLFGRPHLIFIPGQIFSSPDGVNLVQFPFRTVHNSSTLCY